MSNLATHRFGSKQVSNTSFHCTSTLHHPLILPTPNQVKINPIAFSFPFLSHQHSNPTMTSIAFANPAPIITATVTATATHSFSHAYIQRLRRPRPQKTQAQTQTQTQSYNAYRTPSMSAVPAEWKARSESDSESDWRSFRAHLLASHRTRQIPFHHESLTPTLTQQQQQQQQQHPELEQANTPRHWAHRLETPEVGACLVASASHKWPESFAHLRQSVIVLTEMNEAGVSGLILNRPTRFTVATHRSVLSRVGPEFSSNRVMLGGDCSTGTLDVLHGFCPQRCQGASQIVPGLYHNGFNAARALVQNGEASPEEFHFFVAYAKWTADSFQAELDRGAWDIVACSPSLMLSSSTRSPVNAQAIGQRESLWSNLVSFVDC